VTVSAEGIQNEQNDLLRLEDVRVHFPVKIPPIQRLISREKLAVHAVDGVSFDLKRGEILGLVGESGCGKTTLGRAIVRLLEPTTGKIIFEGRDITHLSQSKLRPLRRRIQIVFQDPHASLNPAMTIGKAIGHPLQIHRIEKGMQAIRARVLAIMGEVGLTPPEQLYEKYPADLSGGQKQRAIIARAMILEPELLVVDEGISMLDMSVRAKVLELMLSLKQRHNLTYVFITHDLATAKFLCDRIAVMYLGRIVEIGPSEGIYEDPKHPYTQALLQVIPIPDPDKRRTKILPKGEVPDAIHPPAGCRFHPRCPAVLSSCGWEGHDFIEFLDDQLSNPNQDADLKILGPIEKWRARGSAAIRKAPVETRQGLVEEINKILARASPPMTQAVQSVAVHGDSVTVQFKPFEQLKETTLGDRKVECLLYQ
jgi:oligopeptide/dipeptide ABC transporter ATP-binding protein